ncbi:MAG: hypothetical protein PHE09_02410 [Oscillospiraceae bacterium]|nr:hypothetical protein [Oscillospiraceae bacterium]
MRWIIDTGKDIAVDTNQVRARREYIRRVTDSEVTAWSFIQVNGQLCKEYLCCTSNDRIEGTFITAHIGNVIQLCSLREICTGKFIVANTCIWERMLHKQLLFQMMKMNREVELFFSKQELSVDRNHILRQSTTLNNIGQFGFQTSVSERQLFSNRRKGLMEAIQMSFDRVSPVILLKD